MFYPIAILSKLFFYLLTLVPLESTEQVTICLHICQNWHCILKTYLLSLASNGSITFSRWRIWYRVLQRVHSEGPGLWRRRILQMHPYDWGRFRGGCRNLVIIMNNTTRTAWADLKYCGTKLHLLEGFISRVDSLF